MIGQAPRINPPGAGVSTCVMAHGAGTGAALESNVKSVRHGWTDKRLRALARLADKAHAAKLLRSAGMTSSKALSHCGYVAFEPIVRLEADVASGRSVFRGLKSCHNVWCCPRCSPRISAVRADELNALLGWARREKFAVCMVTLTARHHAGTELAGFLEALKEAKRRLARRRDYAALPIIGTVTATEVTHGSNGWHPHFHMIAVMECGAEAGVAGCQQLFDGWQAALAGVGLSADRQAFHVRDAAGVGAYVAKFGAAEELTLVGEKRGRKGARNPWQLLADARDGDLSAGALWSEFARAFRGRRQLVWSRGLAARAGIDLALEAAAAAAPELPEPVTVRTWEGAGEGWRAARRRSWSLLGAAAVGGDLDAAEFGRTDSEVWRDHTEVFE